MSSPDLGQDARRSRRFRARLEVDLTQGAVTLRVHSVDVSHHGVFLATETPPRERFLVRVTLHLPDGPLYANAFVSRRVAPTLGIQPGVGVQFFAMPERAKRRWDAFIQSLAGNGTSVDGEEGIASFLVRLPDVARLREFFERALRMQSLYMVTTALRPVGSKVAVVMVHPDTEAEFVLNGQITRVRVDKPRGLEVKVDPLPTSEHAAFGRFLLGEDPYAKTPLPDLADPDQEFSLPEDGPGYEHDYPRFPPQLPPVLRSSAPPEDPGYLPYDQAPITPHPSGDILRAVSIDLGGPLLDESDQLPVDESFEWNAIGPEPVIDVDLSEIEGEDLAELQSEGGLRVTTGLPRLTAGGAAPSMSGLPNGELMPEEVMIDLASMMMSPDDPLSESNTETTTPRAPQALEPQIVPSEPSPPPPRARRVHEDGDGGSDEDEDEDGDEDDDGGAGSARGRPREQITGDLFRETTPMPAPRRVRGSLDPQDESQPTPVVTRPPPPPSSPTPEIQEPARTGALECNACHAVTPLRTGHADGELARFAGYRVYYCRTCKSFVSVLRLASSKSRAALRAELEVSGEKVPATLVLDVAELVSPPRCPKCSGSVRQSKPLKPLTAALRRLPETTKLDRMRCPKCEAIGMTVH